MKPFRLQHDPWGRLVLTGADGVPHPGVEPVRAFPISSPGGSVSILGADGREVAWVEDVAELPPDVRQVLEEELARRAFVPVIRRVVSVSSPVEPSEWEVETDRGPTRFLLRSEEDVHPMDEHRALVTDAHGVRYLIPDARQLDATSRRLLERFL